MNIIEQRFLRGPNIYSGKPCLLSVLDLEELHGVSSRDIAGFTDSLLALLPSLLEHRCSVGQHGGFAQRLRDGTYMGHIIEHVTLALECLAGAPAGFGRTRQVRGQAGVYRVVCAYQVEEVVDQAFTVAMELVAALARGEQYALEAPLERLRGIARAHAIGTSTGAVLEAARKRRIPYFRLTDEANLFQLGWGSKQKRLQATVTGDTGHVAVGIASDKQLTKTLLRRAGVPVPAGSTVNTVEEALQAARKLGGAVAVKPLDGNHGRGVTAVCSTPEEVTLAFERARLHGRRIIVERSVAGNDHRVLVTGDRVAAAAHRRPPSIIGDGTSTVRALVERENTNPARGAGHTNILSKIPLDEQAETELRKQGYALDSVPPAGVQLRLRSNANLSSGGTAEDVTDLLPEETRDICVRAAKTIGLDIAGIDLLCTDISQPLAAQGGAIIEINAAPGIRMHQYPSSGTPRDAGGAIVDAMYGDSNGRIPVIAVTGTNGKTTTTLMLEHCVRRTGLRTGCTTTEGVFITGKAIMRGDCSGYWSARAVLTSPEVDFAVLETARGGILKRGLGFDRCDVGVVLNVSADHLGLDGVETLEQLARVKGVIARSASKAVVLNAEDTRCVKMARTLRPGVEVIYFALDPDHPVLLRHLERGGRATYLQDGALILADGTRRHELLRTAEVPATLGGHARYNIANALAAAAALMASGFANAQIVDGLASFVSDDKNNPLRSNVLEVRGVKLVVDYAHNPAAYRAMAQMARSLARSNASAAGGASNGRVVAVVTAPGDRRDIDLHQIGQACGAGFDEVLVYESNNRGRAESATAALIAGGALSVCGDPGVVHVRLAAREALCAGLERCRPGDVLVFACGSQDVMREALHACGAGEAAPAPAEAAA
jgi:cyanophycin synthetase